MSEGSAAALRSFAAALEVSPSVRAALQHWHTLVIDPDLARVLRRVGYRAALGAPLGRALEPLRAIVGDDVSVLAAALIAQQRAGGATSPIVTGLAGAIEQRVDLARQAQAASAAARLSGRLLALLAVAFVVVLPAWRDASATTIVATASASSLLTLVGARWMRALAPRPPSRDDPIARLADVVAGSLAGGVHLDTALEVASAGLQDHSALQRARSRVRLGMRWPEALAASGDPTMKELGEVLNRSIRQGTPIRGDLLRFAVAMRDRERAAFELHSRRAPVLMVLPLTLCLLPAFAIVVLIPLLRGLG